jgi:hypothetical protein
MMRTALGWTCHVGVIAGGNRLSTGGVVVSGGNDTDLIVGGSSRIFAVYWLLDSLFAASCTAVRHRKSSGDGLQVRAC